MQTHLPPERLAADVLSAAEEAHVGDCRLCLRKREAVLAAIASLPPETDDGTDTAGPTRLAVGARFGQYQVEAYVGGGGMADVYRARHVLLRSAHAIKVLRVPTDAIRARLVQEGQEQAKISSPHVVRVTDIVDVEGQPGLVMEYIEGSSLRRRLQGARPTMEEADVIAQGIFAGVAAAHRAGTIHRDLKPDNILLADRGEIVPMIADFGLAKVLRDDRKGADQTQTGSSYGTPRYMAPEQWRDTKSVDARADVWSTGAILYELVCGAPAFGGDDVVAVMVEVCAGRYRPVREVAPNTPQRMIQAIEAALRVDPAARAPSIEALATLWRENVTTAAGGGADPGAPRPGPATSRFRRFAVPATLLAVVVSVALAAVTWPTPPPAASTAVVAAVRPRVLVLPFQNIGGDASKAYLSDGVTEDVIGLLTRFDQLQVLARNTSFHYQGTTEDIPTIAATLEVRYVLTGSLRSVGEQVRVTSELVDGQTGAALWLESFDRQAADPRQVEEELAAAVVRQIVPQVQEDQLKRIGGRPSGTLTAYEHALRGRHLVQVGNQEANDQAKVAFELAAAADPSYPGGEIGLGRVHYYCFTRKYVCDVPWQDALDVAIDHLKRGIELDKTNADAYAYLAAAEIRAKRPKDADEHIRRGYELNPGSADVLYYKGHGRFFAGDYATAVEFVSAALALDPYAGPNFRMRLGWAYYFQGDYDAALVPLDRAIAESPKYVLTYPVRAAVHVAMGNVALAQADAQTTLSLEPTYTITFLKDTTPLPPEDLERMAAALRVAGFAE